MEITSGKLKIRNATPEDAKQLSEWWNDGAVMAHAGFPNGLGINVESVVELINRDNDLNRSLIIEIEDQPVGEMNYRTPEERTAEIGIKICRQSQQNKGYGTEFLRMLLTYIFEVMDYDKVILDTNLENERAQHVYEKLGFRKIRTNIDSWENQVGVLQSSIDYEMLKEDFEKSIRSGAEIVTDIVQ